MSKELDTLIEELCESGEYMSLNVYATRNGEPIYAKTAGYADRENGIRTAPDTIFHLFSMSKPVTAAAVMKLWEDGRIDRKKLGNIVFHDPAALADLNAIAHRYVGAEVDRRLRRLPPAP